MNSKSIIPIFAPVYKNKNMQKAISYSIICILFGLVACNPKSSNMQKGDSEHKFTNKLINESSPYLLQHAHNPVNWHPWGEEALEKAKKEDKLIIVSIGYAACHWCHVMEHESFEDSLVASIMNEYFVPIKVDREERPDVDNVYMTACQLISGRGGWPLNAFALPDGKPIWAGTYYPKDQWIKILEQFKNLKETDYQSLKDNAQQLTEGVQAQDNIIKTSIKDDFDQKALTQFNKNIYAVSDYKNGGRTGEQKFPMPTIYDYLLKQYRITKDEKALETVNITLEKMALGGIYDQLGGGFARYSTDKLWLAPHFEKMLYDNGQLVSLYSKAYALTKKTLYKNVVEESLGFIKRELTHTNGAFYSALDADSEGEEGKFYVWSAEELKGVLGEEVYPIYKEYYSVKENGNWEDTNILHRTKSTEKIAKKFKKEASEIESIISKANNELMAVRDKRIRPGLDDKIITSWNALMVSGYIDAYKALGDENYKKIALRAMDFIVETQMDDSGKLYRNFKNGKSSINAFLDDYALSIFALVDAYEITFDEKYLNAANLLAKHTIKHFLNEETGMFFYTSSLDPPLVARKTELNDNVIPGSNSAMGRALHELGTLLYNPEYTNRSVQMLSNMSDNLIASDRSDFSSSWSILFNDVVHTPYEIAIVGPDAEKLRDEMSKYFLPDALFLGGKTEGNLKLLEGKLQGDDTFIYVCQDKVCKFPVRDVKSAVKLMTR